jgi:hypothetical protein
MSEISVHNIVFPPRRSTHEGRWLPLYLEPLIGSGERICIGVAASDGTAVEVAGVPKLDRLASIYGRANGSLTWAAEIALQEISFAAKEHGIDGLADAKAAVDGMSFGQIRRGAGSDLSDLVRAALRQASSLAALDDDGDDMLSSIGSSDSTQPAVVAAVKRIVATHRPELRDYFNRQFSHRQAARPLQFGFVGHHLAANFTQLSALSPSGLAGQVDRAKARLLDLESLRDGKAVDTLPLKRKKLAYELYVIRPARTKSSASSRMLREAEATLESQADEFRIQWRPFESPTQMARTLMQREAVGLG